MPPTPLYWPAACVTGDAFFGNGHWIANLLPSMFIPEIHARIFIYVTTAGKCLLYSGEGKRVR